MGSVELTWIVQNLVRNHKDAGFSSEWNGSHGVGAGDF